MLAFSPAALFGANQPWQSGSSLVFCPLLCGGGSLGASQEVPGWVHGQVQMVVEELCLSLRLRGHEPGAFQKSPCRTIPKLEPPALSIALGPVASGAHTGLCHSVFG